MSVSTAEDLMAEEERLRQEELEEKQRRKKRKDQMKIKGCLNYSSFALLRLGPSGLLLF